MSAVSIRPGVASDWPHVGDSFWHSYHGSPYASGTPAKVLMDQLDALLSSPSWTLLIACATEEPTEILGWLLVRRGTPQRAAWLYVKPMWRGKGVGRALVKHADLRAGNVECAFMDPDVAKWAKAKGYTLRLRPHMSAVAMFDAAKGAA